MTKVDDERRRPVASGSSTTVGGSDSPSADSLATEFSSLRSEVGELSKAVRQLVDRKPEGHAGMAKRTQGQKPPAEDAEVALVNAAPWTEVVRRTVRKKNSQTLGEQVNGE